MPNINTQNFYWLPILKEDIWDELQSKNYQKAGEGLRTSLKTIPAAEWENTFWVGIIKGFPMLRANLSEKEWRNNVLPTIAQAVLETASGEALANIYKNLDLYPEAQKEFQKLIIEAIPGETEEAKLNWLKTKRPPLYTFLIANLAQELGVGLTKLIGALPPKQVNQRYKSLPQNLKNEIFSYANAEDIFRIGSSNHFSEEKISSIAMISSRVLMGFIHLDDITKEIQEAVNIDSRIATTIGQELSKKIFSQLRNGIRKVYDPITGPLKEATVGEKTISLKKFGEEGLKEQKIRIEKVEEERRGPTEEHRSVLTQKTEEGKPFDVTQGKPLVLHEEKPMVEEDKKPFKGFDFPFSFMKPKTPGTSPTKVKIEVPGAEAKLDAPPSPRLRRVKEEKEKKRVVHYSESRTPLSPFGKPEKEVINLETLERNNTPQPSEKILPLREKKKPALKTQIEKKPQASQSPLGKKEGNIKKGQLPRRNSGQATIEGNIVDLR
ncbi:MAG: hypothetical protein KJI72_02205 [Patescibacteria group bacterium]|nr:hypothetical protein [Patescibacteria group bacterium]